MKVNQSFIAGQSGQKQNPVSQESVVSNISQCAKIVMASTEDHAVSVYSALHFMDWAYDFFYTLGNIEEKMEVYRCQLILKARKASIQRNTGTLKKLCLEIKRFDKKSRTSSLYKYLHTESVARIYELTGNCFIKQENYSDAIQYLEEALNILKDLAEKNPTCQVNTELKQSILQALHFAKHTR